VQWTKEEDDLLRKLHVELGLSASLVAEQIRGKTRNAVIGRIHRLGLPRRGQLSGPEQRRRVAKGRAKAVPGWVQRVDKKTQPPRLAVEPFVAPVTNETPMRTFADLQRGECHWPIGDPGTEAFGYCGCKSIPGQSYCENHRKRAYQPVPIVRKDRVSVPADEVSVRETEGVS